MISMYSYIRTYNQGNFGKGWGIHVRGVEVTSCLVLMSSGFGMANALRDWMTTYVYIDVC